MQKAAGLLESDYDCKIETVSSIYETKPYGIKEQGNFLNAVIKLSTEKDLGGIFQAVKQIEKETGRTEGIKWGPREIDLDILFFNELVYKDERIKVPHEGIEFRDFVLTPLNEIAPNFFHPVLMQKISDICSDENEKTIIRKIKEEI